MNVNKIKLGKSEFTGACLWCNTTQKSIQTYFCNDCEKSVEQEIKSEYVDLCRKGKLGEHKAMLRRVMEL